MRFFQKTALRRATGLAIVATVAAFTAGIAAPKPGVALDRGLDDRVRLHRTPSRGLDYAPTSRPGSSATGKSSLRVDVISKINLDGNPLDNAYSSLLPLDYKNDGKSGFLHWNGYRIMRLYSRTGSKVWQVTNPSGRHQGPEAYIHRDSAVITDLDGDGKLNDILHCWQSGSTKRLVERDGATGKEIRHIDLPGQSNTTTSYCHVDLYRKQSDGQPIILVAENQSGGSAACNKKGWIDNWVRVAAFDRKLKKLWQTDTCDAGHHPVQVDANNDGKAEYVFVGRYALDLNGKIRCTLSGWGRGDHVDAIRIGKLDPKSSKLTAVAVGRTGGGAFDPATCKRLWTLPKIINNPQELMLGQFDPAPKPLSILVTQRGSEKTYTSYVLNTKGGIVRKIAKRIVPMQNAQMDGDKRTDEIFAMFGEVFTGTGKQLLSRSWYWNLRGTKVKERRTSNVYDSWAAFPVLSDVDHDGREEIVTWGQSLIVVGRPH